MTSDQRPPVIRTLLEKAGFRSRLPPHLDPPSGHFDVLDGRCVGSVRNECGFNGERFTIFVERERHVHRSGDLGADHTSPALRILSHGRRCTLTPLDFALERVGVFAQDARGGRSALRLDGASQIEILRRHAGRPQRIVEDLDFSTGGNAQAVLGDGWHGAEPGFRWTDGRTSTLHLKSELPPGRYELSLLCNAFIHPPVPGRAVGGHLAK